MVWWIVAVLVVGPSVVLAVAAVPLPARRAELRRALSGLAAEVRAVELAARPGQERMRTEVDALAERVAANRWWVARVRARVRRTPPPRGGRSGLSRRRAGHVR